MKLKGIIIVFTIIIVNLFLVKIKFVSAFENLVTINEIMWAGSSKSNSDEWIELKNNSNETINIKGWEIVSASSSGKSIFIPNDQDYIINAKDYFLISNYNLGDENTILNITPDYVTSSLSLSNSNNGNLVLKNNLGEIIDEVKGDAWPAGDNNNKASMERIADDGLATESWQSATKAINLISSISDLATPKAENSPALFTSPSNYPEKICQAINLNNSLEANVLVSKVIDGDTIEAQFSGKTEKIRLIGIDTPESENSSDFGVDEPYYQESKQFVIDNLLNKEITLLINTNISERYDNYDRLLAIIIYNDSIFNIELLKNGLAKTYYLENPLIISEFWKNIELDAQSNNLGIWNNEADNCIFINEFMPNPYGSDEENEWIELANVCPNRVNIKNWFIDDEQYGSKPYLIKDGFYIDANGFFLINAKDSNTILNNTTDSVRLFNSNLQLVDEIIYQDVKENYSYAKYADGWRWTDNPTPNSENIYLTENTNVENISDLKNIDDGKNVVINGYANVATDVFSKQYFYIQDDTGGTQIYNYSGFAEKINSGDYLIISGEKSQTEYLRIKSQNIQIISTNNIIDPIFICIDDINNNYEGRLIQTQAIIESKYSNGFYLKTINSRFKLQIKDNTNIKNSNYQKGDLILLSAIVSVSNNQEIILLPRSPTDIIIKERNIQNNKITNVKSDTNYLLVKGIITALPGTISNNYFYLQSGEQAWQIYNYKKIFPNLKLGEEIEVYGKISNNNRLLIYDLEDIKIIAEKEMISPKNINNTDQLTINYFVKVSGNIIKKSGKKIIISDGNNIYTIYLKNVKIASKELKIGNFIIVNGIVEKYSDGFRIVPREISDTTLYVVANNNSNIKKSTNISIPVVNSRTRENITKILRENRLASTPQNSYNKSLVFIKIKTIIYLSIILYVIILFFYAQSFINTKKQSVSINY